MLDGVSQIVALQALITTRIRMTKCTQYYWAGNFEITILLVAIQKASKYWVASPSTTLRNDDY